MIFYVETINNDNRTLQNVFVKTQRNGILNVITAARGYQQVDPQSGDKYLLLEDGYRYEGQPGDSQFKIIHFAKHGILLEEQEFTPAARKIVASSTPALWGRAGTYEKAELQWRIAMPLATILLAALAIPLSRADPRQGRFAKLFIAIVIYAVYMNFLAVARSWLEHGTISASLGLWWVHGALLAIIFIVMARQAGIPWLILRLSGKAQPL